MNNCIKKGMEGQGWVFFREWNKTAAMGAQETPLGPRSHTAAGRLLTGANLSAQKLMEKQDICGLRGLSPRIY